MLTDDNPRSEDPGAIVRDIRAGVGEHPRVSVIHDRRAALQRRASSARGPATSCSSRARVTKPSRSSAPSGGAFNDRAVVAELLGGAP